MKVLIFIVRLIDGINKSGGWLAAVMTIIMIGTVFFTVIARYGFSHFQIEYQEAYVLAHSMAFMLGAGYCLMHDGHVRIDVFYASASETYKAIVNILGSVFLALPLLYMIFDRNLPFIERNWPSWLEILTWTWQWKQLESSWDWGVPGFYAYLRLTIAIFAILFALQFIALILRSVLSLAGIKHPPFDNKEKQE